MFCFVDVFPFRQQFSNKPSEDCSLHSSIVSGNFRPPVSGRKIDRKADSNALKANITVGIAMWVSASCPTKLDNTPPILATNEHEPTPAFLKASWNYKSGLFQTRIILS